MAMLGKNSVVGTIFKLNINMDPIDGKHMDDVDWEAKVYVSGSKSLTVKKNEATRIDKDNYIISVDSSQLGAGKYNLELTVRMDDSEVKGGKRVEVRSAFTGVTIDAK